MSAAERLARALADADTITTGRAPACLAPIVLGNLAAAWHVGAREGFRPDGAQ